MIFVCLSCCKENECIFQLLELWLDSKDTFVLKKSVRDWQEGKEECIPLHYKQEQSLTHISNIMYILFHFALF